MSGKTIRTSLGAAPKATQTDWSCVKKLSDKAIDAAIAADPDAYALETEVLGRKGSAYHYVVYKDVDNRFRWKLVSANGEVLASSETAFRTKAAVTNAIAGLRSALLGGDALAA